MVLPSQGPLRDRIIALINGYLPKSACEEANTLIASTSTLNWDWPSPSNQGDNAIDPMFIAVGYSLTIWEEMDARMAILYYICSKSSLDQEEYFRGSDSHARQKDRNLNEKINIISKKLSNNNYPPELQVAWKYVSDQIRAASKRRNDIGHGIVRHKSVNVNGIPSMNGTYLVSKEDKATIDFRYLLTSEQIVRMGNRFRDLRGLVDDLISLVLNERAS